MINRWKKNRSRTSILGLAIGHDTVEAVELRRSNGSAEIRHSVSLPLEADPFARDPETAGRALRRQLEAAGIRESWCAICIPPDVLLGLAVPIPDLPDSDVESFLQIEAERGFPRDPDDLIVAQSISVATAGARHATLLAVPRDWVEKLEAILKAARLKPVSLVPGLAVLQPPGTDDAEGTLALLPAGHDLGLQLTCHGAIAGLRVIGDAFTGTPEQPLFDVEHVSREIRITFGQLPTQIRSAMRRVRIFGQTNASRLTASHLGEHLRALGLSLEEVPELAVPGLPFKLPAKAPSSSALACAAQALAGRKPDFEFLPPRVSPLQQLLARYPSGRLAWVGGAAGAVAALLLLTFLSQQVFIWRWQSKWDSMKGRVAALEKIQKEIRQYRPWFDESVRSLGILRRITEAFPEDGAVYAKTIEIRAGNHVTCTGTARTQDAWLRMLEQLRNGRGITDVQVEQVHGKAPVEFTFNFRWEGPGGS